MTADSSTLRRRIRQQPGFHRGEPAHRRGGLLRVGEAGPLPPFLALNVDSQFQGAKFLGGFNEPLIAPVHATGLTTLQHNYYGTNSQARFNQKYACCASWTRP